MSNVETKTSNGNTRSSSSIKKTYSTTVVPAARVFFRRSTLMISRLPSRSIHLGAAFGLEYFVMIIVRCLAPKVKRCRARIRMVHRGGHSHLPLPVFKVIVFSTVSRYFEIDILIRYFVPLPKSLIRYRCRHCFIV